MPVRVLAIDPGVRGAVAALERQAHRRLPVVIRVLDTPTAPKLLKSAKRRQVDPMALYFWMRDLPPIDHVVVEAVHSMPEDGVVQAFAFGHATASIVAAASIATHLPVHEIQPSEWHAQVGVRRPREHEKAKAPSVDRAREIWPDRDWPLSKDGRAEAALIGLAAFALLDQGRLA